MTVPATVMKAHHASFRPEKAIARKMGVRKRSFKRLRTGCTIVIDFGGCLGSYHQCAASAQDGTSLGTPVAVAAK
jgi:hypothetical protein